MGDIGPSLSDWVPEDRSAALAVLADIEAADRAEFAARRKRSLATLRAAAGLPPVYDTATLDWWQVDPTGTPAECRAQGLCREFARRAVLNWDAWRKGSNWLHLYGGEGTGKSLLAAIFANGLLSMGISVIYLQAASASEQVRETYNNRTGPSERALISRWVDVDMLILDELGAQTLTDHDAGVIWKVINGRYHAGRPMIVITNFALVSLEQVLGPNIVGRIVERSAGPWALDMCWPSWRRKASRQAAGAGAR